MKALRWQMTIGIFLVSLSAILVEISLTRLFSVTIWYHFAFLVISFAMLGFGASGSLLAMKPSWFQKEIQKTASLAAALLSIACAICLVIVSLFSLDLFKIFRDPSQLVGLCAYGVSVFLPFFFAGLVLSAIFSHWPKESGKLYFANLSGSAAASLLAVPLIAYASPQGAIMAAVALSAFAAWLMRIQRTIKKMGVASLALIAVLFLLPQIPRLIPMKIVENKGLGHLYEIGLKSSRTLWNAFSRIDVVNPKLPNGEALLYAPGLPQNIPFESMPEQRFIFIDSDATTPITRHVPGGKLPFLGNLPSELPYRFLKQSKVCIIGAGGGLDVLAALMVGSSPDVTAVEINPLIGNLVRGPYSAFSGGLYEDPRVHLKISEGRSYIRNSHEHFDIIQLSLVDTWAAANSGAYSLTENYLYTTEAFQEYLDHLTQRGLLTVTRWLLQPPNEVLRLVNLAASAMNHAGLSRPQDNIALIESGGIATLIAKKSPFTQHEVDRLTELCFQTGVHLLYSPDTKTDNEFSRLLRSNSRKDFVDSYPLNISPPTDDKPFFFHAYTLRQLNPFRYWRSIGKDRNSVSFLVLLAALIQAVILSVLLIVLPLYGAKKIPRGRGEFMILTYFALIGLGFMFVEIIAMQKLILVLGNPIYSLAVVLFSLLTAASLGSWLTSTWGENRKALGISLASLGGVILVYSTLLPHLPGLLLGMKISSVVVISVCILAPLGFLMGMPFPSGILLAHHVEPRLVPWAWAVNSCLSVVGSILAVLFSMSLGFTTVMRLAAFCYLLGFLIISSMEKGYEQ